MNMSNHELQQMADLLHKMFSDKSMKAEMRGKILDVYTHVQNQIMNKNNETMNQIKNKAENRWQNDSTWNAYEVDGSSYDRR